MEEIPVVNKDVMLGRCGDPDLRSNFFSLSNTEVSIIEKEEPELCDADVFLPTGVHVDNEHVKLEFCDDSPESSNFMTSHTTVDKEDNGIDSDPEYANYDEEKCFPNDEKAHSYPIKLEKKIHLLIDPLGDKVNNVYLNQSWEQRRMKLQQRNTILKRFFILLCPCCGIEIETIETWKKHVNRAHDFEKNLQQYTPVSAFDQQCNVCKIELRTKSKDVLRGHTISHMPHNQIFKCSICCQRHISKVGIRLHLETKHVVVRSALEHSTDMDSDTADSDSDIEFESIGKGDDLESQEDNALSEQKPKVPKNKDAWKKYMIRLCPVCGKECGRLKKKWWKHIISVHNLIESAEKSYTLVNESRMQCNECKTMMLTHKRNSLFHRITHLPYKQFFKCKICSEVRSTAPRLRFHIGKEHRDIVRRKLPSVEDNTAGKFCIHCEKNVECKNNLLEHMQKQHREICPVCGIRFSEERLYRLHINTVHTQRGLSFEEEIVDVPEIVNHRITRERHTGLNRKARKLKDKLYVCPSCGEEFNTIKLQKQHLKVAHDFNNLESLNISVTKADTQQRVTNLRYFCNVCNQDFKLHSLRKFKSHAFEHMSFMMYKCTRCHTSSTKLFPCPCKQSAQYTNSISFICPQCNVREFKNEKEWLAHIQECHADFVTPNGLNFTQIQEEDSEKFRAYYKCNKCQKIFKWLKLNCMLVHWLAHMSRKCFICKLCRYRTKRQRTLRIHLYKKHFSPVELICGICSQATKTHYEFSTHMRTAHTNITMWPKNLCPICVEFLADGINVDLHIKTKHSTDDIESYENETESKLISVSDEQSGLVIKNEDAAPPVTDICTEMILPDIIPNDSQEISSVVAPSQALTTSMATCSIKSTSLNKFHPYMTYACPECNIPLPTQKEWHFHITTKHDFFAENALNIKDTPGDSSRSICLECGTTVFGGVLHKQRHKLTHMPYRSFICTICLHRSKNQNGLFDHIQRRHFTPGEYKCEMCTVVFKTACERYTHAKTEHKDIEWPKNVCPICVSTVVNFWSMKEHLKTHDYDREKFPCGYCNKFYLSLCERNRHEREQHPLEFTKEKIEKEQLEKRSENKPNILPTTSKRKRGRPKAKKTTISDSDPDCNELIVSAKRKRGRPRRMVEV